MNKLTITNRLENLEAIHKPLNIFCYLIDPRDGVKYDLSDYTKGFKVPLSEDEIMRRSAAATVPVLCVRFVTPKHDVDEDAV